MTTIVAIEGADQVGKETQANLLTAKLRALGYKVEQVEIPRKNGLTYRTIYWMLENGTALKYPRAFQFVQYLNKLIFQSMELPDLRKAEVDFIVLDRWSLSSVIYGVASGVEESYVMSTFNSLIEPDCTVILHGPAYPRKGTDSYERNTKLQEDVREAYKKWALDHPRKYQLVHVTGRTREEVSDVVMNSLQLRGVVPMLHKDEQKGRVDLKYNPMAMDEDIFIPVRECTPKK